MHAAHTQPIAHSRLTQWLSHTPAPLLQQDGFADDTVRMIKQLRTANPAIQVRCNIGGVLPREGGPCWAGLGPQILLARVLPRILPAHVHMSVFLCVQPFATSSASVA
jgi:hypothetical protein